MAQYQYILPSITVSRQLFEELNRICANDYLEENRSFFISVLDERLSGRDTKGVSNHLDVLTKYGDKQSIHVADMVKDWLKRYHAQRSLIHVPYDSPVLTDSTRIENKPGLLREVTQDMYDSAVINGFPQDFFRDAEFFVVNFYCLPDGADFRGSWLKNCTFAVCRVSGVNFENARIYDSQYYSSLLEYCSFEHANLAHTHFRDCEINDTFFRHAWLKRCNTTDCTMERVGYSHATLDGCSFQHVTAKLIRGLSTATITQGGATEEEAAENRTAVLAALRAA